MAFLRENPRIVDQKMEKDAAISAKQREFHTRESNGVTRIVINLNYLSIFLFCFVSSYYYIGIKWKIHKIGA